MIPRPGATRYRRMGRLGSHTRLHGEVGHTPPSEYEATRYLTTTKPQVTTNI